jgi:hypothetical protein
VNKYQSNEIKKLPKFNKYKKVKVKVNVKVKQPCYRPGVAQRVPGIVIQIYN